MSPQSSEHRLYALHDLDEDQRPYHGPDLRGWPVVDREQQRLGTVDALMVEPDTKNVRYLQVHLDKGLLDETNDSWRKTVGDSAREDLQKEGALALIPVGMAYVAKGEEKVMADTALRESYGTAPRHTVQDEISAEHEERVKSHYLDQHQATTPENSDVPQIESRAEGMSSDPPERNEQTEKEGEKPAGSASREGRPKLSSQPMRPERLHTSGNSPGAPDSLEAGAVSSGSMGGSIEPSTPKGRIEQSRMRKDRGDVTSFYGDDIYDQKRFFKNLK